MHAAAVHRAGAARSVGPGVPRLGLVGLGAVLRLVRPRRGLQASVQLVTMRIG